MRIGKIIGTVTLSRSHPLLAGATYRIAVPLSLANLQGQSDAIAEELVLYDELGAGQGSVVAISEGGEAAQPFYPQLKPIDAYNAAILDNVLVDGEITPRS
jgi:microcompartment protein CcmK/EutM